MLVVFLNVVSEHESMRDATLVAQTTNPCRVFRLVHHYFRRGIG